MAPQPPPTSPRSDSPATPYSPWWRVPISLVGLMIALAPAPVLLLYSKSIGTLWQDHALGIIITIVVVTAVGSYLCVRALVRTRWVAIISWVLLALGFLVIDSAIGLFFGCIHALRNV